LSRSAWIANLVAAAARTLTGATAHWINCAPEPRQRVYFANHTSNLDFVVLWSVLPRHIRAQTRPVAAKDYWQSGLRKRLAIDVFNAILVERSGTGKAERSAAVEAERSETANFDHDASVKDKAHQMSAARHSLELMLEALDANHSLIIFPEGTRGKGGPVGPFKSGLYYLWQKRPDVQFVPVYLANLNRVLPKGEVLPVPFISRVAFGPPLQLAAQQSKESFLKEAREALCALQLA
jgi:1-acyl-sn-glycerol-3-phosphate acyltransferase